MKLSRCVLAPWLIIVLIAVNPGLAWGAASPGLDSVTSGTAAYLLEAVPAPSVGAAGGEWTVMGLARSDCPVPSGYYDNYYDQVVDYVQERNGVLHDRKYTEYSRVILALTALGRDPADVGGYNLLQPLGDFDKTSWQGINGSIFALLALDSGAYEIPHCEGALIQATRQMYVDDILGRQLDDGGFALSGSSAEPDVTGMALQALAKYQDQPAVKNATDQALACLSTMQDSTGGYQSWGAANLESTVQVIMALCELGVDVNDQRFVKNGLTLTDNMLSYYTEGAGFQHSNDGLGVSGMATEQAFYALVNLQRVGSGQSSLYRMSEASTSDHSGNINGPISTDPGSADDLATTVAGPNQPAGINVPPVINAGISFADITGHPCQAAIEALASRGIVNGLDANSFAPGQPMTRAEFAAIVTRSLGLAPAVNNVFADVPADRWYAPYVGTAYNYGIVGGTDANAFSPELTITREEAAVMVTRAAGLCGMDTAMDEAEIQLQLAQFDDYTDISPWASPSMAFCCESHILSTDTMEIQPSVAAQRGEIADMLYRMLTAAHLL